MKKSGWILTACSFDGVIAGADVSGTHEEGSAAKMGTSTGNQDINYQSTKRSFTNVHN